MRRLFLALVVLLAPALASAQPFGIAGFSGGPLRLALLATASATTAVDPGYGFVGHTSAGMGFDTTNGIPYLAFAGTSALGWTSSFIGMNTPTVFMGNGNVTLDVSTSGKFALNSTLVSTRTTDIGWSVVSVTNQACNTTCTNACVVGFDAGTSNKPVVCTDATADACLCAGAN